MCRSVHHEQQGIEPRGLLPTSAFAPAPAWIRLLEHSPGNIKDFHECAFILRGELVF